MVNNELKVIDPVTEFMCDAKSLDLSQNPLRQINFNTMHKCNVERLDLGHTKIKLSPKMFEPLKELKYLTLEESELESIDVEVLTGLKSLETLILNDNQLSDLDYKKLVKIVPSLKVIDIHRNYFSCDFVREMIGYVTNNTNLRVMEHPDREYYPRQSKHFNGIRCDTVVPTGQYYWFGLTVIILVAVVTTIILVKKDVQTWLSQRKYKTMTANPSAADFQATVDGTEIE